MTVCHASCFVQMRTAIEAEALLCLTSAPYKLQQKAYGMLTFLDAFGHMQLKVRRQLPQPIIK